MGHIWTLRNVRDDTAVLYMYAFDCMLTVRPTAAICTTSVITDKVVRLLKLEFDQTEAVINLAQIETGFTLW